MQPTDKWSVGDRYEPYIGRWSRLVAPAFVEWLELPPQALWLDVGCGTGAMSDAILGGANPSRVHGVDPSAGFIAYVRRRVSDAPAAFVVGDAQSLPARDASYDAVVAGLVLNFIPDRPRALREMVRVVRDGGTVAAYVWDYLGEMWLLRHFWEAAAELDPAVADLNESRRFAFCRPTELETFFGEAGLREVSSRGIVIPTEFTSFDEYWTPFLGGQGPAPTFVQSLDEGRRTELREALRARLPTLGDGSIRMTARAWAVRGRR
jgi:ubiquinone/menaquinone biosynthesis C-methylase UbiE